jgi:sec-independent protein translocase protein TatA
MWRDLAQPSHLLILALLVAVLFGWKRLPDMARSMGRSMRIFKSEVSEMKNDGKTAKPSPAAADTVRGEARPADQPAPGPAPSTVDPAAPAPQRADPA